MTLTRIWHGISEGLLIESHLQMHLLYNYFSAEIALKMIKNKQDAMVNAKFAVVLQESLTGGVHHKIF